MGCALPYAGSLNFLQPIPTVPHYSLTIRSSNQKTCSRRSTTQPQPSTTSSSRLQHTALHDACPAGPGLAAGAAAMLRDEGWDAVHVSEIDMRTADDVDILNVARNTDRVCITLDHDFHAHLALTKSGFPPLSCCAYRASTGLVRRR